MKKAGRTFSHLTPDERVEIEIRYSRGESRAEIAEALGRNVSTINRELQWNMEPGERKYKATRAGKRYEKRREVVGRPRKLHHIRTRSSTPTW